MLDQLVSRAALHELSAAYCAALDRADAALMRSLFHDDGVVGLGEDAVAIADYAPATMAWVEAETVSTFHSISNEHFEIEGDLARGETYVRVVSNVTVDGVLWDHHYAGRYLDSFARRDGKWAFVARGYVLDWCRMEPANPLPDLPFRRGDRGGRDASVELGIRTRGEAIK